MHIIRIHTPVPTSVDASKLAALLDAAGFKSDSSGVWLADCGDDVDETVLLVVVDDHTAGDPVLSASILAALSKVQRTIVIWTPGSTGLLPPCLTDFGAGAVAWDAAKLRAAICGQTPVWQESGGDVRAPQPMKPNVCR